MLTGWLIAIVDVGRERAAGSGSRGRLVVGLGGWPVVGLAGVAGGGRLAWGEAWGAWWLPFLSVAGGS